MASAAAKAYSGTIWENTSPACAARITDVAGDPITQATTASINYEVRDKSNPKVVTGSGTVIVSSSVFDTYQTPESWNVDSIGYNFMHRPPPSCFKLGGRVYAVEYKFTPAAGDAYYVIFEIHTREVQRT